MKMQSGYSYDLQGAGRHREAIGSMFVLSHPALGPHLTFSMMGLPGFSSRIPEGLKTSKIGFG